MTIAETVGKAIEGGYQPSWASQFRSKRGSLSALGEMVLDPLFWQALSKTLGWNQKEITIHVPAQIVSRVTRKGTQKVHWPAHSRKRLVNNKRWLKEWHRFINHLAEEKDPESFFESLK